MRSREYIKQKVVKKNVPKILLGGTLDDEHLNNPTPYAYYVPVVRTFFV
jgi:hypothetical protein